MLRKTFKLLLVLCLSSLFFIGCQETDKLIEYNSPLEYPIEYQELYKLNKIDKLYWVLVNTEGKYTLTKDIDLLKDTPDIWKDELINAAYTLWKNKIGE